jgi:hypothetical protein
MPSGRVGRYAGRALGANVPAQLAAPADATVPAAHGTHVADVEAPTAVEEVPAAQSLQLTAPEADAYEPAAQGVQLAAPARSA